MTSFIPELAQIDRKAIQTKSLQATRNQVGRALNRSKITINDLPLLLSPAADDFLQTMLEKSQQVSLQRFGRTINLFAPLYLSNYCANKCTYCGYSAERKITRRTLSIAEIKKEAAVLSKRGFKNLLLVTGEDPKHITPTFLKEVGLVLRPDFPALSMETQPFDTPEEYQSCVEGGVDGLLVYQETYDRKVYDDIHVRGKKKRFDNRIGALDRGAAAGMRRLGIGILLGIAEMVPDAYSLAAHANYLQKNFWRSIITISFPRMRPMGSDFTVDYPVDDKQFVKLLCAFRLIFPDNPLILSTRESSSLRDALIPCGITHMSAGVSTEPGGYVEADVSATQFDLSDNRSAKEVVSAIESQGYEAVWKDWQ